MTQRLFYLPIRLFGLTLGFGGTWVLNLCTTTSTPRGVQRFRWFSVFRTGRQALYTQGRLGIKRETIRRRILCYRHLLRWLVCKQVTYSHTDLPSHGHTYNTSVIYTIRSYRLPGHIYYTNKGTVWLEKYEGINHLTEIFKFLLIQKSFTLLNGTLL